MSGAVSGVTVALAGLAVAAVTGWMARKKRFVRERWMHSILAVVTGFFGVAALNLGGLFEDMSFGAGIVAMVGYGLLVVGAAMIANRAAR